jgi:PAS domain S-box-containing protein
MAADVPEILKTLIEALPDGVFVHAPGRGILYANAAFRAFIRRGDDLLGSPAEALLHPDDRPIVQEPMSRALATREPTCLRFLRPDGSSVDGESRGAIYSVAGEDLFLVVVHDLTETQRSQRALARSEAVFHTLIEDLQLGVGSTFRVLLPATARPASPLRPEAAAPESPLRLLVIDDEPVLGRTLAGMLEANHAVQLESSAAGALARLDAGEHYDVILCDLMMPNMTGMDFQETLEQRGSPAATRTLFMTGGAFTPRANAFLARFSGRVLEKPFRVEDVESAVARLVRA